MADTLFRVEQIADHGSERMLVGMVALAPEFWGDVAYLPAESFGNLEAGIAWSRLREIVSAGGVPDPREFGKFIGFEPPPLVRDFALEYARRVALDSFCRAAVRHSGDVAKAAFARRADEVASLLSCPPKVAASSSTLRSMADIGGRVWEMFADPAGMQALMLKTKLRGLDASCGEGLESGTLTVLMARPGMGKTAALAQVSDSVSEAGEVVAVFSKEMTAEQWYRRIACRRARINWFRYKRGEVSESDQQRVLRVVSELADRKTLWIDDHTPQSTEQMRVECERLAERLGRLDLVIGDHLRLWSDWADNEVHRMGKISWGMKMLAKNLNTRVLAAAQLNRAVESRDNKVPDLHDLRDSGEVEENADNVIALFREEYYSSGKSTTAEFHARKVRDGVRGSVGFMDWDASVMGFREMTSTELKQRLNDDR